METPEKRSSRKLAMVALSMAALISLTAAQESVAISTDYKKVAAVTRDAQLSGGQIVQEKVKIGDREFHVTRAMIKSSPEHVWSYLTDYDKAPSVFSNLKKIRLLDQKDNRKKVEFEVVSLGGLVKYDYVLHVVESEPHQMEWSRASGAFKANDGFWFLEPVDGGKYTRVTYAKHIDGGLFVPRMIVDKQLKSTMPNVIANLRSAVASDMKRIAQK
ncbi:hypothetical protein GC174_00550 [bacterium]|nr:hypothetical protein [bacterium]